MNDDWLRRARTPETRARIRYWSRRAGASFAALILAVVGGIAFVVWGVVTQHASGVTFWGLVAGTVILILVCFAYSSHADGRLTEARFADAHVTIGRVSRVVCRPGVEGPDSYDVEVTAELPGPITLRRELRDFHIMCSVGDTIEFRHTVLDPDDVDDVHFERRVSTARRAGAARSARAEATSRREREWFADAHVSIGRIAEVVSYPSHPQDASLAAYLCTVRIDHPDVGALPRQVVVSEDQLRSTGPRFGRTVRVRHRTLDPDQLDDASFDGWAE
ncbi:hypothetical protein [Gordonia hydrophobica]|uniref:DUF4131 domain-containing protein n=1 Tax=Gordonia hydrophobica TaxID=40516 RepID=A0ABZ2U5A9_9ACTN|nr:hypothetical protein [Gordonia hydrophobica]MBM7368707.1 hypothetical protein [Gordonia hydrophobica]